MSKEKITRVKYFTPDKEKYIYEENWKKYKKYLQSNIIKKIRHTRDMKLYSDIFLYGLAKTMASLICILMILWKMP